MAAVPASVADIAILSACAFLGNVGAALTGFGQAIIFLFIWQIIELAGYDGDFKFAVFIQSLSLFSMQPIILYSAHVWRDAYRRVLWLFVPITLISTPLGQLVSSRVPTDIVQAVAGFLVIFVACWELYSKREWLMSCCKKADKSSNDAKEDNKPKNSEGQADDVNAADDKCADGDSAADSAGKKCDATETAGGDGRDESAVQVEPDPESNEKDVEDGNTNTDADAKQTTSESENPKTISNVYASMAVDSSNHNTPTETPPKNEDTTTTPTEQQFKIGCNIATFITLLAGGASGFLGGMVAIRGPPLIFYFLHPPKPISFDKKSQRATGVVIMFCNVSMRMIYYLVDTFSKNTQKDIIFVKEDWRLYLSVVVCSIAGGVAGSKLFEYVKDSKDTIRGILSVLLFLCGISLLFSAFKSLLA